TPTATPPAGDRVIGATPSPPDSAAPRIVRRFDPVIVRARFVDPLSYQTVHETGTTRLRTLPVDDWAQAVALQPGVVAVGEVLHVRGGRAGESRVVMDGLDAGEPFRGRPFDPPLLALSSVAVEPGPFEARLAGALAGTVVMRTLDAPDHPEAEGTWTTDAGLDTHYDRLAARVGAPLPWSGWGAVGSAEIKLDDTALPALRTPLREDVLGLSLGPRAASDVLRWLKLSRAGDHGHGWIETFGAHTRTEPYDPMWTLDGWIGSDPQTGAPLFSPDSVAGWQRYKAADHQTLEDDRHLSVAAGWSWLGRDRLLTLTGGWSRDEDVISLDGSRDRAQVENAVPATFGFGAAAGSSPFLVYGGDEPYQRERYSSRLETRLDAERRWSGGGLLRGGLGMTYDAVRLWELDRSLTLPGSGIDSLRSFEAWAPGGSAYVEGRWPYQGMLAQGGLRLQMFTAGPQSDRQSIPGPERVILTWSPRFGMAFPVSDRDVLSFVYAHLREDPGRDFLYDNRVSNTNGRPIGDPGLVPPTAIHYEVALRHVVNERWTAQASVFQRESFDLIGVRLSDPTGGAPIFANTDDAHAIGLEARIWREVEGSSRLSLAYTWVRAYGTAALEEGAPYGPQLAARLQPLGETPLDWDQRHTFQLEGWWRLPHHASFSWTSTVGSPLPWTPATRRTVATDPSLTNSMRLSWTESTSIAASIQPPHAGATTLGIEVRNLFDERLDDRVSVNGYPHPYINTYYDDYAAWRTETGRGGGAYWDGSANGGPGWVPVGDPRLRPAPRTIRFRIGARW
ncbi:MAG: TonB-dependent receptor plug domain-containing protein, partial [Candidatus Eisenbacteria bacterium]